MSITLHTGGVAYRISRNAPREYGIGDPGLLGLLPGLSLGFLGFNIERFHSGYSFKHAHQVKR